MPITATFTADFTKWNEALKNATANLKPLEVSAKGVTSQLERMARSLSGEKIIKEAQLATAAVQKIGGVTKLTAQEQAKLNATVTEAIAKYAALGQKAPADMLAVAKATKQAEGAFSGIATALGPIKGLIAGAFAVGTVTRLAGEALQFASDLNDLSAKTGISTKALQEFKFAGDQVGVTLDDVSTAVLSLQKHLVGGDKSTTAALKSIGLSFKDLKALRPEEQFTTIASALSKIENPAQRNKLAFDLMGKAAANVLPLIASDLKKTADEAERLGIVLDQQTIDQLDQLGDTWAKMKLAGEALIAKVLVPFAPLMNALVEAIIPVLNVFGKLAYAPYAVAKGVFELQRQLAILKGDTGEAILRGYQKALVDIEWEKASKGAQTLGHSMQDLQQDTQDGTKAFKDFSFVANDIAKVAKALDEVAEKQQKLDDAEAFRDIKGEFQQIANKIDAVFDAEREWTEGTTHLLQNKSTVVKQYFDALLKQQEESHKGWAQFEKDLEGLAQAFATLGQIAGGTLGKIFTGLGKVVGAVNLGAKSVDSIRNGIDSLGKKGLSNLLGGISNLASGLLGAAAAAVELGKALFDAFTKSRPEQLQESVLNDFGVSIGEDLGKVIADSAIKQFGGSFQAAQIGNLDKIISAGGGVTVQNLDKLLARLRDVFSLMETGELTAAQGQDILNKNFGTFVDFLGGKVTPALKEIIRLNEQFGTQSKAIADFVDSEATKALQALTKVITARGSLVDQLAKAKPGSDESKKLSAQLAAQPLTAAGAKAEGSALFGIFAQLTKDGASFIDTLTQMQPVIDSLNKQLAAAGLDGGAAFAKLTQLASIATDEIAGPAFQAIQGFGQALEALNNSNLLDQETFTGLTEQITATFEAARASLVAQGKDGDAALKLIAPQLQEIWELQQDFGYAVDAATQALIDQGVAAGEVGEKHRSIQEQTLDVLKAIADVLGATIPGAAEDAAKAIDGMGRTLDQTVRKIPEDIHIGVKFDEEKIKIPKIPDVHVRIQYDQEAPEAGRVIPLSAGGVAHFANGGMVPTAAMLKRAAPIYAASGFFAPRGTDTVPAMLTPGEFVVNRQGVNAVGLPTLKGINHGTLPGGGAVTTVNVYVNQRLDEAESRKLAAAIAPHLPGAVANGGSTHGKWQRMTKSLAS